MRQGDLFGTTAGHPAAAPLDAAAPRLLASQLLAWQQRVASHQAPLFAGEQAAAKQQQLLDLPVHVEAPEAIAPLSLRQQPLSFWRWPQAAVSGAALYFVIDRPEDSGQPLLLYIGETARAEQRWKGEHDCKAYLAAYSEALTKAGLTTRLSISFCSDVPRETKARRALEQALIQRWLPPFNKETRLRWATPFQAEGA
ncbi:MAG: GIY-YIG nuclease family protein [Cyanobacteriota bacterium]|nr:GIY-YIG nuclease family protein [Cyanobacteriota bacterium]